MGEERREGVTQVREFRKYNLMGFESEIEIKEVFGSC